MADLPQSPDNSIKVFNPYGEPETLAAQDLPKALQMGYRQATPEEIQDHADQQTYGEGLGNETKAFLAGGARAFTFGLSDQGLTKSGLVNSDTLSKLSKYNPNATTAGEVAGVGAGLLMPELELAGAAGEGASAALKASDLLNPVKTVSKIGEGIKDVAAPLSEKAASLFVNPETSPVVHQILSKAGTGALGSAVEGAAYGLGESVSEQALGDPDLNAEKVLANVGHGAFWGGALGGTLDAAIAPALLDEGAQAASRIAQKGEEAIPGIAEARGAASESFQGAVDASTLPETEKQGLIDGLKKLKPNVSEIDQASERLGVQAFPSQRSDSEFVQNRYGMTTQSPTPFGVKESQKIKASLEKIGTQVDGALGPASQMSEAELGNALKKGITEKVSAELDPITDLYENQIKPYFEAVPISEKSTASISRNILKLEDLVNGDGKPLSESAPQYQFAKRVSDDLPNLRTVDDLKRYRTLIRQEASSNPALRHTLGQINEKLANLEESSIVRFAENTMKTPQAKEKVLQALELRKEANTKYRGLMDKLSELGDVTGKNKIYGTQHFLDSVDDLVPEKLAKKSLTLARNNSEALGFLKEHFPNEFDLIKNYIKNDIRSAALENGELNLGKAIKAIDKLSPEAKTMFFRPEEAQVLKDADTWQKAWPKKWGPSGTPQGIQYIDFFKNPISATGMTARDYANLKFSNHFAGSGNAAPQVAGLSRLEKFTNETTENLKARARQIFTEASRAASAYAGISGAGTPSQFEKKRDDLVKRVSSPEKMIDQLDTNTKTLSSFAPQHASSVQQGAIRATQFLQSKLPALPPQKPFSPKYVPSRGEISKFNHFSSIVENPLTALAQVKDGTLTPDTMEALTTVYPKLLNEMRGNVMEELTNHLAKKKSEPLAFAKRQALSLFLGQPLEQGSDPQSIAKTQLSLQKMGKSDSGGPAGIQPTLGGAKSLSLSHRALTPGQATNQRDS